MKSIITASLLFIIVISKAQIQVIGYLPTYRWNKLEELDFDHLSHIIGAFANPDSLGQLSFEKDLKQFAKVCHEQDTKAIISMCGGGNYSWGEQYTVYEKLLETPQSRTAFISNIVQFVLESGICNVCIGYVGQSSIRHVSDVHRLESILTDYDV